MEVKIENNGVEHTCYTCMQVELRVEVELGNIYTSLNTNILHTDIIIKRNYKTEV